MAPSLFSSYKSEGNLTTKGLNFLIQHRIQNGTVVVSLWEAVTGKTPNQPSLKIKNIHV